MNSLLSTSMAYTTSGTVSVLFWATIGGLLVFLGLCFEKLAELLNGRYLGHPHEPHKYLENLGWIILMVGILLEIIVGGASAWDEWQTKQIANQTMANDPRNLPIVSLIGRVCLEVRSPDENYLKNHTLPRVYSSAAIYGYQSKLPTELPFLLTDDRIIRKHEKVSFQLGKQAGENYDTEIPVVGEVSAFDEIVGGSITNRDDLGIAINLYPPSDNAPVFNPNLVTFNSLKFIHFYLPQEELIPPVRVVEGKIDLLINGFFPKTFTIPSQTNNNLGVSAFETNSP